MMKHAGALLVAMTFGVVDATAGTVIYTSPIYTWSISDPTEANRIYRDGTASVYPTLKSFPGTMPETSFYTLFAVVSSPGAYEWLITPLTEGVNSFLSIYTSSFNSSNLSTNYLGDQGSSDVLSAFSVPVSGGATYVIVANGVGGTATSLGHSVQFQVTESDVPEPGTMGLMALAAASLAALRMHSRSRP